MDSDVWPKESRVFALLDGIAAMVGGSGLVLGYLGTWLLYAWVVLWVVFSAFAGLVARWPW